MKYYTLPSQAQITINKLDLVWDVRKYCKKEFAALLHKEKNLNIILDSLVHGCPTSQTARSFEGKNYFRLMGHARSFCMRLEVGGCLVFKGTEPLSQDYPKILKDVWERRTPFLPSRIEHFTLKEDEIFLAMTLEGARYCANLSSDWISIYFKSYQRLPKTPFPLMVFRIDDNATSAFTKQLLPLLSDRGQQSAKKRIEPLLKEGLAVYVYYYHSVPYRAAHIGGFFPGSDGYGVKEGEIQNVDYDIEKAIEGWILLMSEMLKVGFMPTTKIHTGNCLQSQNLAIDGGFCDIDSLEKMSNIKNMRDFEGAFFFSVRELVSSISLILNLEYEGLGGALWSFVWNSLRKQIVKKSRNQKIDKRLLQVVESDGIEFLRLLVSLR